MERAERFERLLNDWQRQGLDRRGFIRLVACGASVATMASLIAAGPAAAREATDALEASLARPRLQAAEFVDKPMLVATLDEPAGLDPQDSSGNAAITVQYCVYEGLVAIDADLKLVNQLAASWEASDDATEYTFILNEGVTFHDGTPCDADAVKASFDRVLNPDNDLRRYGFFSPFLDHVEVVDELTVKFVAKQPYAAMVAALAHPAGAIPSIPATEEFGEDFASNPVGTGPYRFASWARGDSIVLESFEDYWNPEDGALVPELTIKIIPDPSTLAIAVQTEEVQFAGPINAPQAEQLREADGVTMLENDNVRVLWVTLNNLHPPFDNKQVRQALNYGVNKEQVLELAELGYGWIMDSPIAPAIWGYESIGRYEYDPEQAKSLLAEAGFADGFETELWVNSADRARAVAIQGQLDQIGVKVEVVQMEDALLDEESDKPSDTSTTQMLINGWSPSTADADWGLRPIYTEALFVPEGSNRSFYTNPEVEAVIQQGLELTDPEERQAAYAEAQRIIMDDAPNIFLYAPTYFSASRDDVTGVSVTQIGVVYARTAGYTSE